MLRRFYDILVIGLLTIGMAWANDGNAESGKFYKRQAEGWYWYQDPPAVKKDEPKPQEEKSSGKGDGKPQKMTVAWMRENWPKYFEAAMENPTDENVRKAAYLKKAMLDMASNIAQNWVSYNRRDPWLDTNRNVPNWMPARQVMIKDIEEAEREAIREMTKVGGFMLFTADSCAMCVQMLPILQKLKKETGFYLENAVLDGEGFRDHAIFNKIRKKGVKETYSRLGLTKIPALIYATNDSVVIISDGITVAGELTDRIILAGQQTNTISASVNKRIDQLNQGELSSQDIVNIDADDNFDKHMRERIEQLVDEGKY